MGWRPVDGASGYEATYFVLASSSEEGREGGREGGRKEGREDGKRITL